MFEITWHKLWCIMNESQNRKLVIHGNNIFARELYTKLNLMDIPVVAVISDDEWLLQRNKKYEMNDLNREEHYIIFTELENEKILIDRMSKMKFEMFYHYRFLKDFQLLEYYKKPEDKKYNIEKGLSFEPKGINQKSALKIFVLSHKESSIPQNGLYQGLQVGSEGKKALFCLQDKSGITISNKNKRYCELTGIYWLWKNMDIDYIGLCHYRRYFCTDLGDILEEVDTRKLLNEYDILLPTPMKFKSKNKKYLPGILDILTQYQQEHYIKDLLFAEKYLEQYSPDYIEDFWNVMGKTKCYGYNMFITSKIIFNSYCEWLFPILFALEEKRSMVWEDNYQKRVYGFLSERLFNVWISHQKISFKEIPIIQKEYKEEV